MKKIRLISVHCTHCSVRTAGYTLIELMIVLAILAAMAAMVLPAMRGPLDKSRLRGASRQVQAAMSKARFFSIREGVRVEFRYQINGNLWMIQTVPYLSATASSGLAEDELNATPSGLTIEDGAGNDQIGSSELDSGEASLLSQSGRPRILREGELPATVFFAEFMEEDDELSEYASNTETEQTDQLELPSDEFSSGVNELELNAEGERISWSAPVRFLPNGRTEDADVRLSGPRNFFVDLKIRGLTGAISYSAPFRIVPQLDSEPELQEEFE